MHTVVVGSALTTALVLLAPPMDRADASTVPTVTGVSPAQGDTGGGAAVAVTGSGFDASTTVQFGSVAATGVHIAGPTRLTVTAPASVAATVDVRVHTGAGTSSVVTADRFRYRAPLPVTGLQVRADSQTTQTLTWTDPAGAEFSSVVVRRATGTQAPTTPTAGSPVQVASAAATSATVSGLTSGTTYSYSVFAHDRNGQYATPATASGAACLAQEVDFSGVVAGNLTLSPQCVSRYVLTGPVTVPAGVTVTVQAGVAVAADPGAGITVAGTLIATGTAAAPVTIGSAAASPQPGSWPGITVVTGGAASLDGTTLSDAAIALSTATGTHVRVRGQILDSTLGVQAPDATAAPGGVVDARGVWWGDASGPAPIGSGTPVQGSGVVVTPWTGLTVPGRPATARTDATSPGATACADVLFVGARGSDEAPQGAAVDDPSTTERQLLGTRVAPVLDALTSALHGSASVRVVGLRYPAIGPRFATPSDYDAGYYAAVWAGVDQVEATLAREHARCPGERIVLAGYSQGALVVHLALAELAGRGTLSAYPIAAVELIADPARTSTDADTRYGAAPTADSGVWGVATGRTVPLPASLVAHTAEYCHVDDVVCDAAGPDNTLNYDAYGAPHASYPEGSELDVLGQHAAAQLRT